MLAQDSRLRIAMQKSGRLSETSISLLSRCGIKIPSFRGQLFAHAVNFPLDILWVRDDDIPGLVADGVCDYGIVGTNVLEEMTLGQPTAITKIETRKELEFGSCRLAIAVPEALPYTDIKSLEGLRIATSYPNILRAYLERNQVNARIIELSGSVEIAPCLNIADAICDLVSTGATLEANNLVSAENIFSSQAVLIRNSNSLEKSALSNAELLEQRMSGVLEAQESKYIMLHAPVNKLDDIIRFLPGVETPSVMPLAGDESKRVIHAVCRESVFWETLEQLKEVGASSILVLPVEKMMA